jgi:outer membrane protein assembly factor BamE (lipoprotein component of BamABCDE complex)
MAYRNLLVAAVLATGLAGFGITRAETVAVDNGIAVKESDVATPGRGMTMDQVAAKFGSPTNKVPAVGKPPISRWDYPGFVVYFERNYVIHSVVATS